MERVVKRYLMHNQGDFDEIKLNDFDELKQDLTLMKNEFINDIYKSKDDILKNVYLLTNSIKFIAEDILLNTFATSPGGKSDSHEKYRNLMNFNESLLNLTLMDESAAPTTNTSSGSASMSRSTGQNGNNNSEPIMYNNNEQIEMYGQIENSSSGGVSGSISNVSDSLSTPNSGGHQSKKKIEFIDNLLAPSKNSSSSMNENRFFPVSSSSSLYKIVEETTNGSLSRSESMKY